MVVVPASLASSNPAAARPTRASSVLAPASRRPPRGTSAGAAAFTRRRALTMHAPTATGTGVEAAGVLGTMDPTVVARGVLHVRTPLIISKPMSELLGVDVYLKLDALQPSGSFKLRGIGYTCQKALSEGASQLVSSSGGNAGLATAYAGQRLGVPTTVVVPRTTPEFILDRLRSYGATVEVHGAQWSEANERAVALSQSVGGKLVHPFEDEDTWTGHATVVHEIKADMEAAGLGGVVPSAVVTCVGGGGLLAGILQGLSEVGWGDHVPVIAAETEGADCLATSIDQGEVVTLSGITSVAKSLGAASPSPAVFAMCQARQAAGLVRCWRATDRQAVEACMRFADDHRLLVEPACGAALAAVYTGGSLLAKAGAGTGQGPVVVQVCGGAIMDRRTLVQLAKQFELDF